MERKRAYYYTGKKALPMSILAPDQIFIGQVGVSKYAPKTE